MRKIMIIWAVLIGATPVFADQASDSFVSGFAQGLSNSLNAGRYYSQPYQQPVYNTMTEEQLEQWAVQQEILRNQRESIWLQSQQLQTEQNEHNWYNNDK